MKIILNNITEIELVGINNGSLNFQNERRDFLEVRFPITIEQTFEELDDLFSDENNTKKITIEEETTSTIYDNFILKVSVVRKLDDTEAIYSIIMAQKTYGEIQLDALQDTIDVLVMESLGV